MPIEFNKSRQPFSCGVQSQSTNIIQRVTRQSLVYADKPQTLDHLEDNIRRVIADIRSQMLEKVIENRTSRLDYIRANRGSHMPEIIFKIAHVPSSGETIGRQVVPHKKVKRAPGNCTRTAKSGHGCELVIRDSWEIIGGHGSLVVKVTNFRVMYHELRVEDPPCRGDRCTLNQPGFKRPPVGMEVKKGAASSGVDLAA
ncbi:hypothetical protein TNCV_3175541 [Trichonephila clavipes]|nr:hypothetical protein TNCV_3175541 [Trichonephila clavipes]